MAHMCLATPCLAIGEAGGHPLLEDGVHQRLRCEPGGHRIYTDTHIIIMAERKYVGSSHLLGNLCLHNSVEKIFTEIFLDYLIMVPVHRCSDIPVYRVVLYTLIK